MYARLRPLSLFALPLLAGPLLTGPLLAGPLLAVSLVGCGAKDAPVTDDSADPGADGDSDGFLAGDDCDDADAAVNPEASELCNGHDDDCDGTIDLDAVDMGTWYADGDGDDFGADATASVACDAPAGAVATGGDCDDTNASVNPGATEDCDDLDEDCDGEVDEGVIPTWYHDYDGDGYGNTIETVAACDAPGRYVADGTDCNDSNASVNPGAGEVCDTRDTDEDCDGLVDDLDTVAGTSVWYQDTDGDGYGDEGITLLACDPPDDFVAIAEDCDDTDAGLFPGAEERCDGQANDCDATASWRAGDEAGVVSWQDSAGAWTAVTDDFAAGADGAPAAWTAPGDGDLHVCEGTYFVNVTVTGNTVSILGEGGADATVLDGGGLDRVVAVSGGGLTLEGLTLTNGSSAGYGAGLQCVSADLLVQDVIVTGNTSAGYGGGVALDTCVNAELLDTEITDNTSLVAGGLYAATSDGLVLDGLLVDDNMGTRGGAGLYLGYSSFTLSNSTVSNNHTDPSYSAGGLMDYYSDGTIDTVAFTDNAASYGGALEVLTGVTTVTNSTFSGNSGGAVYGFVSSTITFSDTTFTDNTATYQGNIYLDNGVTTTFTDCTFTDNAGGTAGVFTFNRSSSADIVTSSFSGNTPYDAYAAGSGYTLGPSATRTCSDSAGCI
ncbi:MAG: MopE-related protein [Pseudomonadota bacterium]|nr:MopE-related protein [Pseudomonadota bacterium]